MREDLDQIIEEIRRGDVEIGDTTVSGLSDGEKCYIALATGQYYLLPADTDPIEAWHRLDWPWKDRVARWRGWPGSYADEERLKADAVRIIACCTRLGLHETEGKDLPLGDAICQGIEDLRETLREYGRHDPGCSAEIDETKYRCRCGWKRERERIFGE